MSFQTETLRMVQDTVARMLPSLRGLDTAKGVLVSRDVTGLTGAVVFDGSEIAVPVKVSGAVDAFIDDTVALIRTGGYWTVVGALSVRGMGEASRRGPASTQSTLSATYVDWSGLTTVAPFLKFYTATAITMSLTTTVYCSTTDSTLRTAFRITGTSAVDGSAYDSGDLEGGQRRVNVSGTHQSVTCNYRASALPPGTYTVTPRWKRHAGTGTFSVDANSWYNIEVDEIRRQS